MTSRDFCYWLQGFLEIADPKTLNENQVEQLKKHLNLVFFHDIDPSYTDDQEKINKMNEIHNGKKQDIDPHANQGTTTVTSKPKYQGGNPTIFPMYNGDGNDQLLRC